MIITLPTWLTIARIFMTPFIIYNLIHPHWITAGILFALAAISDMFDGALARYIGQETQLGAYIDPLADKILIVSCYMTLLVVYGSSIGIPVWLVAMVIVRELVLVGGALLLYVRVLKARVPLITVIYPTLAGKLTTVIHCVLLGSMYAMKAGLVQVGPVYFYNLSILAVIFMGLSTAQYALLWWRLMRVS